MFSFLVKVLDFHKRHSTVFLILTGLSLFTVIFLQAKSNSLGISASLNTVSNMYHALYYIFVHFVLVLLLFECLEFMSSSAFLVYSLALPVFSGVFIGFLSALLISNTISLPRADSLAMSTISINVIYLATIELCRVIISLSKGRW